MLYERHPAPLLVRISVLSSPSNRAMEVVRYGIWFIVVVGDHLLDHCSRCRPAWTWRRRRAVDRDRADHRNRVHHPVHRFARGKLHATLKVAENRGRKDRNKAKSEDKRNANHSCGEKGNNCDERRIRPCVTALL